MPVILDPGSYADWLEKGARELLVPYAGAITANLVSTRVNPPKNDGPNDRAVLNLNWNTAVFGRRGYNPPARAAPRCRKLD